MRSAATILIATAMLFASVQAEDYIDLVQKGNKAFSEKDYKSALEFYHAAETELPESSELEYNMAGALVRDKGFEQAVEKYTKALNTTNVDLEAAVHYNLGNTHYWMGDYQNSIKSYENSLRLNPDDMDAKYNLELARKMLKENSQPEEQENEQCDSENCEKPEHKEQHEKEKQEQQQQEQEQNEQQEGDEQQPQDQEQQQQAGEQNEDEEQQEQEPQPMDSKELSKEDAERILNALRDDEIKQQKKIRRNVTAASYSGKDW